MKMNHVRHPMKRYLSALAILASLLAALQCQAQTPSPVFTNLWSVGSGTNTPNDLPASGNNVRGVAIDPMTTNVLYASTTAGTNGTTVNHVAVLDSANNGAYVGQVNGSGINVGTLALTQVRVSDDGYVYACDLSGSPASDFRIYRWPSDSDFTTAPTIVFDTGPATSFQWRIGDYMDLRGSGINTEIVATGNGSGANLTTNFVIFRPTDATATTFTNFSITIPGGANICGGGVTFEGANNALWVKAAGGKPAYRVAYNPATLTAQITASFQMDQSANNGLKYYEANGEKMLATVCTATTAITNGIQHYAKVLQVNDPSNAVVVLNQPLPTPNQANGNSIGVVDFQKGFAAFSEPNNGISFYSLGFITNTPAKIGNQPAGATVVETFNYTFSASASGTTNISYQWYFASATATNLLVGKTNSSLALTNLSLTDAGGYFVAVTNSYGGDTSVVATLTVLPGNFSRVMSPVWSLAPGSRDYLTTDSTQRGLGYDPLTGNLVLVSRQPTNGVHLLNSINGGDLGALDLSDTVALGSPGTYPINMATVADDGVVYVANLLLSAASDNFVIYRWDSASTSTVQGHAYYGNPGVGRIGDTFAARGSGTGTELLASFRSGTNVAVFTTTDGFGFDLHVIAVTNLPADAQANGFAGLGLAFGPTNTFWAKSAGFKLRLVQYDLPSLTGNVIAAYDAADSTMFPIGADNANNFVAGIGAGEIPQNLELWDLEATGGPALIDREVFGSDNANGNGNGAVAFDVAGSRAFALDSNNGILAVKYAPRLRYAILNNQLVLSWTGSGTLQRSTPDVAGSYSNVSGATSPYTNTVPAPAYYRLSH
jgi:hypothetical protein